MSSFNGENRLNDSVVIRLFKDDGQRWVFIFRDTDDGYELLIETLIRYARLGLSGFTWDDAGDIEAAAKDERLRRENN